MNSHTRFNSLMKEYALAIFSVLTIAFSSATSFLSLPKEAVPVIEILQVVEAARDERSWVGK